jgi:type II secretory pathway component GspD/PulD (secretin)
METRSYRLRFLRPTSDYVPFIRSEFIKGEQKPATGTIDKDFPIVNALKKALTSGGDLDYIRSQNTIIVRDTTQVHGEIKDIVDRLDIEPPQVFFDVKFISARGDELFNAGIDYGDAGPEISIAGGQIPITLPFNLGSGGLEDHIIAHPTGTGPFADINGNAGNTVIPDTIFGSLSFTGWAATLRLLQRDNRTEVVQAPKVVTLDGRAATIFVGETIRFAEARSEVGQTGSLQLTVQEARGSPVEVGFQLLIIPHVIPGTNTVALEVIPKETSLSGTSDSTLAPPGFDFFQVGSGNGQGSIALPRIRTSTIVTSMLVDSGQTAVIGGLATDTDIETESRVPYLASIPLLGELFKYRSKTQERRILLVFITVTVVRTPGDTHKILQKELAKRKEIYKGQYDRLLSDIGGE